MKKYFLFFLLLISKISISIEPKVPVGIENIGNVCFMNSVVQCLYQIHPLTDFMLTKGRNFYKKNTIAQHYINLIEKIQNSKNGVITPDAFCPVIYTKLFSGKAGTQQDASEFLRRILDQLGDEDIKEKNKIKVPGATYYKNIISDLFLVKAYNKTVFATDGSEDILDDTNFYIQLKIISEKKEEFDSLEKCLKYYVSEKKDAGYAMQNFLQETSDYLIFILDRFSKTGKLIHDVSFPLTFDIKPYLTSEEMKNNTKYELISFAQHSGDLGSGHYTSYVKHTNQWYYANDSDINKINDAEIKKVETQGKVSHFTPTILFYKRIKEQVFLQDLRNLNVELNSLKHRINI